MWQIDLFCSQRISTASRRNDHGRAKEIFLKDYKSPDYCFGTVRYLSSSSGMSKLLEHTICELPYLIYEITYLSCCICMPVHAQVDLKFTLGEEQTVGCSNVSVHSRVEGITNN